MSLTPGEGRQLLAIANMAVGIQNMVAAVLGEDAIASAESEKEGAESGEIMGRRLFMQQVGETEASRDEEGKRHKEVRATREGGKEGIRIPRGSRKRHSG